MITRQDSQFHTHTLPNGLQMIGQQIPGVASAASIFWIKTGTRDEQRSQMGVSHFLEHMAFRKTKSLQGTEVDRALESIGAEHNAATWKEFTFYWARVLGENNPRAIDILSELTHPILESEGFEQERPVILEEIARYEDQPQSVLSAHFLGDYFRDHPLAWETLGTPETIKALTLSQMEEYWRQRYGTRNIVFSIAGNFEWDRVVGQLEELTQHWQEGEAGRRYDPFSFEPNSKLYPHEKFKGQQIAIGMPSVASGDPDYYTAAVLSSILGDDTGSRLYWALPYEGLADGARAMLMDFDDVGLLMVHVSTEPSLAQKALDVTERELERLQSFDIMQDELDRAKSKLNSSVIIGGESTNERVMRLIDSWLTRGRLETLHELRERIDSVTLESLRAYLERYPVWPAQVVTAVGPLTGNDLKFPF